MRAVLLISKAWICENSSVTFKDYPMTYLEVVFRYGAAPGESALRAIDGMREVYGVRRVQFNEAERTVRVEFDASRLKTEAVAKLLRQAGIDVRERLALA
jgi:copper chaperone CopZ